jgi:predicted ABC-type ATPase
MTSVRTQSPVCIVIAGPNGAGKTTFAHQFLPRDAGVIHFVNVDLIAAGLSPLRPELAAVAAGRVLLRAIERLSAARESFAFETTRSGVRPAALLGRLKKSGYRIEIVFLKLGSAELALRRVALRVRAGGHHVPEADVRRRFDRGWKNFVTIYAPLADGWVVWDNSGTTPVLLESGP